MKEKDLSGMRHLLIIMNLILITLGAFFGVQIFYDVIRIDLELNSAPHVKESPMAPLKKASIFPISYYRHIQERNLFRIKPKPLRKPAQKPVEDLANTELNIRLWGTITGKNGTAYAVIESLQSRKRTSEQRLFKEGESVLQAKIEKIYRDKVVLNMEGDMQVLEMEKFQARRSIRGIRSSNRRPARLTRSIRRNEIEAALQNINKVMHQASIRPRANGLYISNIKRGSIFQRLGLRNGDILYGVDGKDINSVDDALGFYHSLKSGSRVALELKRRGRPYTITYRIR